MINGTADSMSDRTLDRHQRMLNGSKRKVEWIDRWSADGMSNMPDTVPNAMPDKKLECMYVRQDAMVWTTWSKILIPYLFCWLLAVGYWILAVGKWGSSNVRSNMRTLALGYFKALGATVRYSALHCLFLSFKSNCQHTCSYSTVQFYLFIRAFGLCCVTWSCRNADMRLGFHRQFPRTYSYIHGPSPFWHTDVPDISGPCGSKKVSSYELQLYRSCGYMSHFQGVAL